MIRDQAFARLEGITLDLTGLYRELATVEKSRAQAYSSGYWSEQESHSRAREAGRLAALPLYLDKLEVQAKIGALTEERDHLRFLIEHGGVT